MMVWCFLWSLTRHGTKIIQVFKSRNSIYEYNKIFCISIKLAVKKVSCGKSFVVSVKRVQVNNALQNITCMINVLNDLRKPWYL